MENSQPAFELLTTGDAVALSRFLEQNPTASEARDANGVTLLMQSLYRGQRELAELIASKKSALDLFEAAAPRPAGPHSRAMSRSSGGTRGERRRATRSRSDGFTALHFACFFRQPEAARLAARQRSRPRCRCRQCHPGHAPALRRLRPQPGGGPPPPRTRSARQRPPARRLDTHPRRCGKRRSRPGRALAQTPRRSATRQRRRQNSRHDGQRKRP
jgi:ankyrin repeat protein